MTRTERALLVFVCVLLTAFIAEHISLLVLNDRNPPTIDPNPPCHLLKP